MKFGNLLKKELGGLLTAQTIASMLLSCFMLIIMGQLLGNINDESMDTSEVNICSLDNSDYTKNMLEGLEEYGSKPVMHEIGGGDYAAEMERLGIKSLVVIPEGFGDSVIRDKKPAELQVITKLGTNIGSMISSVSVSDTVYAIEQSVGDSMLLNNYGMTEEEAETVKNPVLTVEYSTFNGKTAKVPSTMLISVIMTQYMIAPIAIFFMLMMASQMIMSAISAEKIDKTLETLLSAPVSRITILTAKMTAAFTVALLSAVVMIIGFAGYIFGMMGSAAGSVMSSPAAEAALSDIDITSAAQGIAELGMTLSGSGIVLVLLQILMSIAIGLALALILGALCEDAQSLSTLLMPIMLLVMIPFFITMFADVNSMDIMPKLLVYLIPFSHSYLACSNVISGEYAAYWGGFAYQAVFFAACMYIAVRMFTTDKIFTMTKAISDKTKKRGKM